MCIYGELGWPQWSKVRHRTCDWQPTTRRLQELQEKTRHISSSNFEMHGHSKHSCSSTKLSKWSSSKAIKTIHILKVQICFKAKLGWKKMVLFFNSQTYKDLIGWNVLHTKMVKTVYCSKSKQNDKHISEHAVVRRLLNWSPG